MMFDG